MLEYPLKSRYAAAMKVMIWIGAALAVLGLIGVLWCLKKAAWLRKAQLEDDQVRTEVQRLIFAHMAAIGAAFLGLGLLVTGILLS